MADLAELEARINCLEAVNEIQTLKARYAYYADRGYEGAGHSDELLAELFTEQAVVEGAGVEQARGRAEIIARCKTFHPFGLHLAINPLIEIYSEQSAKGWWHALVPLTSRSGRGMLLAGRYEDTFVRTPEGWRFERLKFSAAFRTPYEDGWAKTRFVAGDA